MLLLNKRIILSYFCVCGAAICALNPVYASDSVERITVSAKGGRTVDFFARMPEGYSPAVKRCAVLVYFGGRGSRGEALANGKHGWTGWADENKAILLCPDYRDADEYWKPARWSGKMLLSALDELKKRHPNADVEKIGYYGYSAGSQAANFFAAWRPARCRAWAAYGCGVFHTPTSALRGVHALLMCGNADHGRAVISRDFAAKARRKGVDVMWKSYPNATHRLTDGSYRLAYEFMSAYLVRQDVPSVCEFVGDDQDATYFPADSAEARLIPAERRTPLHSKSIAEAWGREGRHVASFVPRVAPRRRPAPRRRR